MLWMLSFGRVTSISSHRLVTTPFTVPNHKRCAARLIAPDSAVSRPTLTKLMRPENIVINANVAYDSRKLLPMTSGAARRIRA